MALLNFDDLKKAWTAISTTAQELSAPAALDLEHYKKLHARLHPGPYYYYIFNVLEAELEFVSPNTLDVLGYDAANFTTEAVLGLLHPEDIHRFIVYEQKVAEFFRQLPPEKVLRYKVSYDYRLRCADGSYKWIVQQVSTLQSTDEGAVIRVLGIHTDISTLKTCDVPSGLSFYGLEGAPSFENVLRPSDLKVSHSPLSLREREIVQLMLLGIQTDHIASRLSISPHTVKTHRKNIFRKTEVKTLVELGAKVVRKGWI